MADMMVNFAQYVQMQGGIVIYTGELERYLKEKLGRRVSFQKVFREGYSDPERHGEFTSYLVELLVGTSDGEQEQKTILS